MITITGSWAAVDARASHKGVALRGPLLEHEYTSGD